MTGLAISEDVLQATVVDLARLLGLLVFHTYDSRRSTGAGFPDLVIAGPGGVLFVELKTATGRVDPKQTRWLDVLRTGGADVHLWRPAQLADGTIRKVLTCLSKPRPQGGGW